MTSKNMPVKAGSGKTPTCKVCGDESSGYHYGVDSCEGCKGFFRRCITQGMTHKCSNEEKCEITPFTRNSCQYCRLKKCFAVGMAREASRLGRRPKRLKEAGGEQKRETNVPIAPYPTSPGELYKLRMAELQRLLQQNGTFRSELMQAFLQAAQHSFREHQRSNNSNDNHKNKKNAQTSRQSADTTSFTSSTMSSPSLSTSSQSPVDKTANIRNRNNSSIDTKVGIIEDSLDNVKIDPENTTVTDNNLNPTLTSQTTTATTDYSIFPAEVKTEPDLDNSQFSLPDNLMPSFSNAASPLGQFQLSPDTMMMMPDVMEMMQGMDPSMMTGMPMMSPPECGANWQEPDDNANEIDVERIMEEVKQVPSDMRQRLIDEVIETVTQAHLETVTPTHQKVQEANERFMKKQMEGHLPDLSKLSLEPKDMWQKFVNSMVYEITQVVRFCKKLPGFTEIKQDDQIILIKKGSFEILLNRMCLLVDHENQMMFDPEMQMKCPRDIIKNMPMGFFIQEFFSVASQINPLHLLDEEVGIFSSVLIMCPEREGLENIVAVEKLHSLFLQSLYFEMRKNHNDYESKFARLLGIIPVFKHINRKHAMALNAMKMQKDPVIEQYPPLPKEIYDIENKN